MVSPEPSSTPARLAFARPSLGRAGVREETPSHRHRVNLPAFRKEVGSCRLEEGRWARRGQDPLAAAEARGERRAAAPSQGPPSRLVRQAPRRPVVQEGGGRRLVSRYFAWSAAPAPRGGAFLT